MNIFKKLFIFAVVFFAVVAAVFAEPATASAEELFYTAEYAEDGIRLPVLHLSQGESYKVEVFCQDDYDFLTPLPKKDAYTFIADKLGNYTLRYLVNKKGIETYEYATLKVTDSTVPSFTLSLKETYEAGSVLSVVPNVSDNTAAMATVSYRLIRNGKDASDEIENGVLTLSEPGTYKLQVTVTDGGGNVAKETLSFTVKGDAGKRRGCKSGLITALPCGGSAIAFSVMVVLITQKRRDETDG